MNITGTLKSIGKEEKVSEKFTKREFVITDASSQYPQHISFQLTQQKTDMIEAYKVGQDINVHFNLRGREWTSPKGEIKYFNTLEAWRIEPVGYSAARSTVSQGEPEQGYANEETDDLPF